MGWFVGQSFYICNLCNPCLHSLPETSLSSSSLSRRMKTGSTATDGSEYSSEEFALPDYADDVKELTEDDDITVLKVQPMKEPMRAQVKQHSLKKPTGVQSKRAKRRERRALEKIIKKNLKTNRVWLRKQTVRLPIETLVRLQEAQKKKIDDIAKERHCKTCSVKDILSMGAMVSISVSDPYPFCRIRIRIRKR